MTNALVGADPLTLATFVERFVETLDEDVAVLEAAFRAMAPERLAASAHRLKSAARSVGAHELAELCASIERAAGDHDAPGLRTCAAALADCVKRVIDAIERQRPKV